MDYLIYLIHSDLTSRSGLLILNLLNTHFFMLTIPATDALLIAALNSGDDQRSLVRSIIAAKTLASSSPLAPATTGTNPRAAIPPRPGVKGFQDGYRLISAGNTTEYYAELPYNPVIFGAELSIEASLLPLPVPPALRPIIQPFAAPVALTNAPANLSQWIYRLAISVGGSITIREDILTGRDYVIVSGSIAKSLNELLADIETTETVN